jgi:hypothetical protein
VDLHAIAAPFIAAVNPLVPGVLKRSTGYTTAADGKRAPTYAADEPMNMQVQALDGQELKLVESLNIQGIKRAIHLPGDVKGVDRAKNTGGDLVVFGSGAAVPASLRGTTWLVTLVMETWDTGNWCRVAVVKQNGS